MTDTQTPFADVLFLEDGFSIPELKWRELVFIGALRAAGARFLRDPTRPLPVFAHPGLFPEGVAFRVQHAGGRVRVRPEPAPAGYNPP